MPSNPTITLSQPQSPFIGQNVDLTISFDNTGDATGFGPFVVLFLDATGADGDDGLIFPDGATGSYLGSPVPTTKIVLNGGAGSTETITVHDADYDITVPEGFEADDTLVVFELPFGSFVPDQPVADINATLNSSNLADLGQGLNIETQGGFIFGDNQDGDPSTDAKVSDFQSTSVEPQLVTLQKNYLGPEDETATGPNFGQQYEVVVSVAPGQEITGLDVSDILPETMQFVEVISIVDADGNNISDSRITEVDTPDDGGLTFNGTRTTENDEGNDGAPTPGGTVTRRIDTVTGTGGRDIVMTVEFFVPRIDADGDVIIDADTADDTFDQNESELGGAGGANSWNPIDDRDSAQTVSVSRDANDATPDPDNPEDTNDQTDTGFTGYGSDSDAGDELNDPDKILEEQAIAIQKGVANTSDSEQFAPGDVLEYTLNFQVSDYFAFEDVFVSDTFSDGQRFDDSFIPTLSFNEHDTSVSDLTVRL